MRKIAAGWLSFTKYCVVCSWAATMPRSIVEDFVQGRSVLKRLLVSFATAVAIVLAFGPASALACDGLGVDKVQATAGETVNFTLSTCQVNDDYQLRVFFEKPDSQDPTPEQSVLASGIADDTTVKGDFTLPSEIGDADQLVTLHLTVFRNSQELPDSPELQMRYLATAPPGDTGPSGSTGSASTDIPIPAAIGTGATTLPKSITRTQQRKKNKARAKAKAKSKAKTKSPAKTKTKPKKTQPVTPVGPVAKAPPAVTPLAGPVGGSFKPSTLPKPSAVPPPGLGGPPPSNGTPIVPPAGSPAAPLVPAVSTGPNGSALNVPFWLIAVLGLMTLGGLGGAQTRMLGFWGPLPPMGRDPGDARLLALQRVAQSGATSQKRIAELKRQTNRPNGAPVAQLKKPPRDRTPVG
jgi:hypothetical protein